MRRNGNIHPRKNVEGRDRLAALKDQAGGPPLHDIGRIAAQQADLLIAPELNGGGEVQGLLKPLLDLCRLCGIGAMWWIVQEEAVIVTRRFPHYTGSWVTYGH